MEKVHKEILGLMGKIDIKCRDERGVVIVELTGQLDIYNAGDLQKLIGAYMTRGCSLFAVDLQRVTYLDSSTISIFITCHQKLQKTGGRFLLAGLTGLPREVFAMAKLHDVLEVVENLDAALAKACA